MGLFGLGGDRAVARQLARQLLAEARSLNNPAIPLSADGIISILGNQLSTKSGTTVGEMTAMKMATVWRCVSLISGTIAQLPLKVYERRGDEDRQEIPNQLLRQPYPDLTPYEFIEQILTHILLWGNAYVLKVPNNAGNQIVRLLPLQPWSVSVARGSTSNGSPYGPKTYVITNNGTPISVGGEMLTDDEIIHIPGFGYDGVKGLSPVAHARETIGLGLAAEEFASRLFGSGALMGGVLQTDQKLSQDQADAIKVRFRERIAGLARAHEVAVLDAGLKFQPISISPDDAQFLQSRQFSVNEVCRFFGVPPHLVADVEKSTSWGTGIGEQSLGFVRYTLGGWLTRVEQRLTMHLLPADGSQKAEFYVDDLLRGDTAARYAAYGVALASGWMNRNEVRKKENMASGGPDLDVYGPVPAIPPPLPFGGKEPNGA